MGIGVRGRVSGRTACFVHGVCLFAAVHGAARADETADELLAAAVAGYLNGGPVACSSTESVPNPLVPTEFMVRHEARFVAQSAATAGGMMVDYRDKDYLGRQSRIVVRGLDGLVEAGRQGIAIRSNGFTDKASWLVRDLDLRTEARPLFHPLEIICDEIGPPAIRSASLVKNASGPADCVPVLVQLADGPLLAVWIDPESTRIRRLDVFDNDSVLRRRYEFDEQTTKPTSSAVSELDAVEKYRQPDGYTLLPLRCYKNGGQLPDLFGWHLDGVLPERMNLLEAGATFQFTYPRQGKSGKRSKAGVTTPKSYSARVIRPIRPNAPMVVRLMSADALDMSGETEDKCLVTGTVALGRRPETRSFKPPASRLPVDIHPWFLLWSVEEPEVVPPDAAACAELALRLASVRRYEDAVPVVDRLATRTPRDCTALTIAAEVYRGVGRMDEAWSLVQRATKANPDYVPAQRIAGLVATARGDYAAAVHALKAAFAASPQDVETCRLLARARLLAGDPGGAAETYSFALKSASSIIKPRLTTDLGWALLYAGRAADAVVQAKLAQTLDESVAEPVYLESLGYLFLGQGAQALDTLARALEADPQGAGYGTQVIATLESVVATQDAGVPTAKLLLASLYEAAGLVPRARELYRKYMVQPQDPDLKKWTAERLEATKHWKEGH